LQLVQNKNIGWIIIKKNPIKNNNFYGTIKYY
jgi:hypothetical protein